MTQVQNNTAELQKTGHNDRVEEASNQRSLDLPPVSIIVTVKNEKKTIELCLKSLLNLDYKRYEILLVDTGSTDGTFEVAERIAKDNPKVHTLRTSGNASAGRNRALEAAGGEIVAFTDGDCIASTDWLNKLVSALIDEPATTAGVGGPNIAFTESENIWSRATSAIHGTFLGSGGSVQVRPSKDGYVRSISTANSAFRPEHIRRIGGFDTRLGPCEDSDLCRRIAGTGLRLRFIRDAIVLHHREYHSLRKFGHHMFKYGQGRGEAILVRPRTNTSMTSLAITSFIAFLAVLFILSLGGSSLAEWILIASTSVYFSTLIASALVLSKGVLVQFAAAIPAFFVLHVSYATGLVTGMLTYGLRPIYNRRH